MLLIWSGIRESNPRLDLGKVAYYHYTNPAHGKMCDVFIYSMGTTCGQGLGSRVFEQPHRSRGTERSWCGHEGCPLVDFHNARGFHDGRFLLAFREFLRAFTVDIDAGEFFAVRVIHGDLPVVVLPPAIALHAACLFRRLLFQVGRPLGR